MSAAQAWNTTEGYRGLKVFSATKARDREVLGEKVTAWVKGNNNIEIGDEIVQQSSDNEFHCLSIVIFYR